MHVDLGGMPVLRGVGFAVPAGAFACLLGPSGCGKSTLLRAIAGFLPLRAGRISVAGECLSEPGRSVAPEKRRVGMVFQDQSLFPHLDIAANVGFGLSDRRRGERRDIVEEMLQLVGLNALAHRYPHELSGGQQQRVALARALAPAPALVLLDEPFSGLDGDLRERLGLEVRSILEERGTTAVMVTHDQQEAFALGELVGVMHMGAVLQRDTAYNLYHRPVDRFVASFVGQGAFVSGTVAGPNAVATDFGMLSGELEGSLTSGTSVDVLLRPDDVLPASGDDGCLLGTVRRRAFRGAQILYSIELHAGPQVYALFPSHHDHAPGAEIGVRVETDHLVAFARSERTHLETVAP